jgi:protein-disulfide isomerase
MKKLLTAFTTLLATALPASAQESNYLPVNGQELSSLLQNCQDQSCMSYVSGVINGIGVYAFITQNPSPFCTDDSVNSSEIRESIISVVKDTPRLGEVAAPAAILAAFSRNWPCVDSSADAITNDIDDVDETGDLIDYSDLDQVDIDTLLDFVSKETSSVIFGDMNAPLESTLHVFDDPNCEYCNLFSKELDELADAGWKIIVYTVSVVSDDSKGYAALQYALKNKAPEVSELLYRDETEGKKDISSAMQIAQQTDLDTSVVLDALASTNPYFAIETNNSAFKALGALGTPTWILGDRISSGILDAAEILRIQKTMNPAPENGLVRPGMKVD